MIDNPGNDARFVSAGHLPRRARVAELVDLAHQRHRHVTAGETSQVYPALARADPDLFGVCVASVDGAMYASGDTDVPFPIMSVAKPFVFALVLAHLGPEEARRRIGVNATGLAFNSLAAVERSSDGRTNPMVNPGAIATASLLPGDGEQKWQCLAAGLSRFAGHELDVDDEVYSCASETNLVNRAAVQLLNARGLLGCEPGLALDLYTRQSCLRVTARDLAVMGATLANGGVNPISGDPVIDEQLCHYVLAVMITAGLYETSGDWLYEVGQPGKSGIGGGIVTVSPGKGGFGTFAPPLDAAGNSVKGQLVARDLARALGLDLLDSHPLDADHLPIGSGG
nr:glutaminase A [Propionicimonas sp.]